MINHFQRNILNYAYLMYKSGSPVCEFGNFITYFKECSQDKLIKNLKKLSKMNLVQIQGDLVEKQMDKVHVNYSISIKITDYGINNIEAHQKSPWITL
uniref:DNA-binding HxlR family transcriptional regulator n=1 Tax=Methanococcus maripaludis (strain C6 / ATCC BAA-1332) TaxID=444158 RepID=A9A8A6_METM6